MTARRAPVITIGLGALPDSVAVLRAFHQALEANGITQPELIRALLIECGLYQPEGVKES